MVGGGAAGFFCAVNAARLHPHLKVVLLEKSSKLLSKVKISGGGRCNVTHHCFEIDELIHYYPRGKHFLKKAFHHFNVRDTIDWFAERNLNLVAEVDGRMFPSTNASQSVIDCLLNEANRYNVEVLLNADVVEVESSVASGFKISLRDGRQFVSTRLCIACGGFSKKEQFQWIERLGHSIETPVPSLFTFNIRDKNLNALMGVSVPNATAKLVGEKFQYTGPLLITHWGLSGPAILKLSAFGARLLSEKKYAFSVAVNWLGSVNEQTLQQQWVQLRARLGAQKMGSKNPFGLPLRLWEYLLQQSGVELNLRWADLKSANQQRLIQNLTGQVFEVNGKTTFKEEFVTAGGICLKEIHPSTMESKMIPGLYFAGEVMDVDGITGGFNFQHAWTSGYLAAVAAGKENSL